MTPLRCIILLQFTTTFAAGQLAHQSTRPSIPGQPEAMVRRLYREVVAHHPMGIPEGADMKLIKPYLSKPLLKKMDVARACYDDYIRHHPDPNIKAPFGWPEDGLFSGGNERGSPGSFHVESVQPQKDGSFSVHVRLKYSEPYSSLPYWYVDVIVVQEEGHFVVDDVVYLKDENHLEESRLSQGLAAGCDGSRWVGYGEEQNDSK